MRDVKTATENIKPQIISRTVSAILHTRQNGPDEIFEGQAQLYYFKTVIELDQSDKFIFADESIGAWTSDEKLYLVNKKEWGISEDVIFIGQKVKDIEINEYQQIYFRLENDVIIYHTIDLGDQLFVIHFSDLYDENGQIK